MRATTLLLLLCFLAGCTKDDVQRQPDLQEPETYVFTRAGESTVAFPGQQDRILMATELVDLLSDPTTTDTERLLAMWRNAGPAGEDVSPFDNTELNISTKSVRGKVAASRERYFTNASETAAVRTDFETWIGEQVTTINANREQLAAPGTAGQILDGDRVRYVNAQGLELDQVVGKGLISALMIDQVLNNYLSAQVLDEGSNRADNTAGQPAEGKPYTTMEHKWDEAYGYVFGLAADPTNPLPTLGNDDQFLNKYLGRVNAGSAPGIAERVFNAFKHGRAAITAADYEERDRSVRDLRMELSRLVGLRAAYYLRQAADKITANDRQRGSAFHDLSEAYGFLYGLQFTNSPLMGDRPLLNRAATLDLLDRLMNDGDRGLWTVTPQTLNTLAEEVERALDSAIEN